jgi:hypothetical protein
MPLYITGETIGKYPTLKLADEYPSLDTHSSSSSAAQINEHNLSASPAKKSNTCVHPSVISDFPDLSDPRPDEVDNYPPVLDWLRKELLEHVKHYKKGAFKDYVKITMGVPKILKLLIGSPLTTPAEKEILRRGWDWVNYLDNQFGGKVKLSRFHPLLYSGVFLEKVFRVFRDDGNSLTGKEEDSNSRPVWGLTCVGNGFNDRTSVGENWNILRTPRGHDNVFDEDDGCIYKMKLTDEGLDLYSSLGKVKPLIVKRGVVKSSKSQNLPTLYTCCLLLSEIPPEKYVPKGEKMENYNMSKKTFAKITESWLGEDSTRQRSHTGKVGVAEIAENARFLQRKLGRVPNRHEIMVDTFSCVLADLAKKTKGMNKAERKSGTFP